MANNDTVPGLGFKDKDKALETIKNLEGRDSDYQKLAVKGLIGRAKRTLQVTKAEDKLTNIKEAMQVFEKWLKDFEKQHIPNWSYLPLATVDTFKPLKCHFDISDDKSTAFIEAYRSCDGEYKKLRTVHSGEEEPTWDIIRNKKLTELLKKIDEEDIELWDDELPTKEHIELIIWAYSPDASRIKKQLSNLQQKLEKFKIDDESEDDEKETKNGSEKASKNNKRKSEDTSDSEDDSDTSPSKKKKE